MNQSPQVKVELSHQQLSLLRALIIQYKNAWQSKGELPTHIADLLDSTDYQLVIHVHHRTVSQLRQNVGVIVYL